MNLRNLQFLFKPSYWLMNYEYSKEVDEIINELLDKYEITEITGYTCMLGNAKIWIENQPYACCYLYGTKLAYLRPSRLTIKRFLDRLNQNDYHKHKALIEKIRKDNGLTLKEK